MAHEQDRVGRGERESRPAGLAPWPPWVSPGDAVLQTQAAVPQTTPAFHVLIQRLSSSGCFSPRAVLPPAHQCPRVSVSPCPFLLPNPFVSLRNRTPHLSITVFKTSEAPLSPPLSPDRAVRSSLAAAPTWCPHAGRGLQDPCCQELQPAGGHGPGGPLHTDAGAGCRAPPALAPREHPLPSSGSSHPGPSAEQSPRERSEPGAPFPRPRPLPGAEPDAQLGPDSCWPKT